MTLEFGNIGLNIRSEVMMMKWYNQMRGEMDSQNLGRQVTK